MNLGEIYMGGGVLTQKKPQKTSRHTKIGFQIGIGIFWFFWFSLGFFWRLVFWRFGQNSKLETVFLGFFLVFWLMLWSTFFGFLLVFFVFLGIFWFFGI